MGRGANVRFGRKQTLATILKERLLRGASFAALNVLLSRLTDTPVLRAEMAISRTSALDVRRTFDPSQTFSQPMALRCTK